MNSLKVLKVDQPNEITLSPLAPDKVLTMCPEQDVNHVTG